MAKPSPMGVVCQLVRGEPMWAVTWTVTGQTLVEADCAEQALDLFRALGSDVLEDGDEPSVLSVEMA